MKQSSTLWRNSRIALGWLLILSLIILLFLVFGSKRESFVVGKVRSLEKTGTLFKTYEVQMLVENGDSLKIWNFSVADQDSVILKNLEASQVHNQRVKVEYREKYIRFFWQPESRNIALSAGIVEN